MLKSKSSIFPILEEAIYNKGYKKKIIAKGLRISQNALSNKLTGKSSFTWNELCAMQKKFFPDISKDYLLRR